MCGDSEGDGVRDSEGDSCKKVKEKSNGGVCLSMESLISVERINGSPRSRVVVSEGVGVLAGDDEGDPKEVSDDGYCAMGGGNSCGNGSIERVFAAKKSRVSRGGSVGADHGMDFCLSRSNRDARLGVIGCGQFKVLVESSAIVDVGVKSGVVKSLSGLANMCLSSGFLGSRNEGVSSFGVPRVSSVGGANVEVLQGFGDVYDSKICCSKIIGFQQSYTRSCSGDSFSPVREAASVSAVGLKGNGKFEPSSSLPYFSLYVGNIPPLMVSSELRIWFSKYGLVVDAFIPHKKSRLYGLRFAFVRFRFEANAIRVCEEIDGLIRDGFKVQVNIARFAKMYSKEKIQVRHNISTAVDSVVLPHAYGGLSAGVSFAQMLKKGGIARENLKQLVSCAENPDHLEAIMCKSSGMEDGVHKLDSRIGSAPLILGNGSSEYLDYILPLAEQSLDANILSLSELSGCLSNFDVCNDVSVDVVDPVAADLCLKGA